MMDLTKEGTMDYATFKHSVALRALNIVVAATLATARPCSSQVRVEFTPFAGAYVPTSARLWPAPGTNCTLQVVSGVPNFCDGTMRQETSPAVGGRITAWLNNRTGIDLSVGYSGSRARVPSTSLRDTSASIVAGSARVLVNLTPRMVRTSFYVAAGASFVAHGGDAYAALNASRLAYDVLIGSTTGWGPVLGVVTRFMLAPSLAIRADLEDHHYKISGGGFQNDLVFSLGLSATLLGRGRAAR